MTITISRFSRAGLILLIFFLSPFSFAQIKSPNVSANALFLGRHSNFSAHDLSTEPNGFNIQETEVAFYADVDPYSRLNVLLSIHPTYTADATNHTVKEDWVLEPEELYAESNHIPNFTLKLGKFKTAFGKHNTLHTHAFPFIDAPLINAQLLGDEGLTDAGLSAAYLFPTPWYSELTMQYIRGAGENSQFNSTSPNDGVGIGHVKNLWDLTESSSLEAGVSYAGGPNSIGRSTSIWGADVTLKWRPVQGGKYRSGIVAAEYIDRRVGQKGAVDDEHGHGFSLWTQYQFAERWAGLARYDYLKVAGADSTVNSNALTNVESQRYSVALAFTATEFSAFRLQYAHGKGPSGPKGESVEQTILLQASFTIGAHPAHTY